MRGWEPEPGPPTGSGPEPRASRSTKVAIGATIAVLLGAMFVVGMVFHRFASADHLNLFDDPQVEEAVSAGCTALVGELEAGEDPADAVRAMVAEVRQLGSERLEGDHPAIAWLADWERWADAGRGAHVTDRMKAVAPDACLPVIATLEQRGTETG